MSCGWTWVEVDGGVIPLVAEDTGPAEVTLRLAFPELEDEEED